MIRVWAPGRLHFGLLSFPAAEPAAAHWPDRTGQEVVPARAFGGVGLMVESPAVEVCCTPAAAWSAEGPLADRALACAGRFAQTLPNGEVPPHRILVRQAAPEHRGLGSGTQLGLAVARALALAVGRDDWDAVELARRVGRGLRSALGIHGFARGGFLVEAGKGMRRAIAPLALRLDFPDDWRIVLAAPGGAPGLHGAAEREAFARLGGRQTLAVTEALCRLVLLGLVPALVEQDLDAFGEALHDFNARVGEVFAPVQGGIYADGRVAELVNFARGQGVRGVGQSSWGPAVFALTGDEDQARHLAGRWRERFGLSPAEAFAARACNCGHTAETVAGGDHF
jgi:beta-RFAP synthase